jgi:hypothetical protein
VAIILSCALLLICITVTPLLPQIRNVLFREDFQDLANWKPLTFPKIDRHTTYSVTLSGKESYLKAESNASASALVFKKEFDVYKYPRVRWRWKVANIYANARPAEKAGDDYPIRVYIIFRYDPDKPSSIYERLTYAVAKKAYGDYPPHSTVNYVWASSEEQKDIIVSPYTNRAMIIALRKGAREAGIWKEEEINILDDYKKAFGKDPPSLATIAVMNDSDNTGESSISYVDYIEVSGDEK